MILSLIILLILLMILGLPIFVVLWRQPCSGSIAVRLIFLPSLSRFPPGDAPVLLAIPLFTFAGYLLARVGHRHGWSGFQGAFLAGFQEGWEWWHCLLFLFYGHHRSYWSHDHRPRRLLLPALILEKYDENFSLGLMTISGSPWPTFSSSLPIILYGFVSGVSIEKLFMAGVLPGAFLVGILCLFSIVMGKNGSWRGLPFPSQNSQAL